MKNGMTIDEYMLELDAKKARAEAFMEVLTYIDREIQWKCDKVIEKDSYYEDYVDENGETKRKYHGPVYKEDENGDYIFTEPTEDSLCYREWKALKGIREEILAII